MVLEASATVGKGKNREDYNTGSGKTSYRRILERRSGGHTDVNRKHRTGLRPGVGVGSWVERPTFSNTFSVDLPVSGEYFSNNTLSSWSDERRDAAYVNLLRCAGANWRTVALVEYRNSREQRTFLTVRTSAFLYQI